jgi:hypothetical protein
MSRLKGSAMRFRKTLAIILCVASTLSCTASVHAGLIHAIVEKHKANPEGLHAKIHAKVHAFKLAHPKKPKGHLFGKHHKSCE